MQTTYEDLFDTTDTHSIDETYYALAGKLSEKLMIYEVINADPMIQDSLARAYANYAHDFNGEGWIHRYDYIKKNYNKKFVDAFLKKYGWVAKGDDGYLSSLAYGDYNTAGVDAIGNLLVPHKMQKAHKIFASILTKYF